METTEGEASLAKRLELESYKIDVILGTGSLGHVRITKKRRLYDMLLSKFLRKLK